VLADDGVGVDDVAARLGHFFTVLAEDDALVKEPGKGLGRGDDAEVVQYVVPEARIEQVQHRVLRTADVEVRRAPVRFLIR